MLEHTIVRRISLVVPVYRGEKTLRTLVEEILPMTSEQTTPLGIPFIIGEVLLVHDCGPDGSEDIIEILSDEYSFVRPVWLSRNYGQHAATLAGMASAAGDWVATIDEDGQQDPKDIGGMLDAALLNSLQLVYAQPSSPPSHGWLRNLSSRTAKAIASQLAGNKTISRFNSFRLVDGEIARTLAAYCGHGVYLDVGLFWITGRIGHSAVKLRKERGRELGVFLCYATKPFLASDFDNGHATIEADNHHGLCLSGPLYHYIGLRNSW